MTSETRMRKTTRPWIAFFEMSAPQLGPMKVEETSDSLTPYALASAATTAWLLASVFSFDVWTRTESLPTFVTSASAFGATRCTASVPTTSSVVLALLTRNSEPPLNSRLRLSPRPNNPTSDSTMRTPEIAYQVRWRLTNSIDRSPVY